MYTNIRKKLNKFSTGGDIRKFETGGVIEEWLAKHPEDSYLSEEGIIDKIKAENLFQTKALDVPKPQQIEVNDININDINADAESAAKVALEESSKDLADIKTKAEVNTSKRLAKETGKNTVSGVGIASNVVSGAVQALDAGLMGDKNFGALSEAIDQTVHAASSALMKSGNPYCAIAGMALEGANFLTKAGGETVLGYDVDINNSGFGTLNHMESSSSRDWATGLLPGLGGLIPNKGVKDKLARRNEQVTMALTAAEISADLSFEQEARMNTVEDTIMNNLIALAGGLETSMLGG